MENKNSKHSWIQKHILPLISSETTEQTVQNIVQKMIRKSTENPDWHLNPSCLYKKFTQKDPRQDVVRRIDEVFKNSVVNS